MTVFKNTYLIMRHGQSEANVADIVVSDPEIGCLNYGLSPLGQTQAKESAIGYDGKPIDVIFCSDFKRTKETAGIVASVLSLPAPIEDTRLRERFFGEWEGRSSSAYENVWEKDFQDSHQSVNGVESTMSVRERSVSLITDLETQYENKVILLVAHGDILQIMKSAFHGIEPGQHRSLPHHETGEMKLLASIGEKFYF
ncbi:histidine phosphatase family protein [Grimontia sp. NTOU-MAR1]|uniref:histidine phosphatase family protein n=1 Tax=Grimontia sp. NTOU-MAR1 TaxID=3111011 RepID=UPI002DBB1EC3|nr:histidine phosphatase family protein [Grimontia sp. NTOU-MAR1]WRW00226.1 histidine phosphatase family protein [Grimontia sp. NTOU-MAR1]